MARRKRETTSEILGATLDEGADLERYVIAFTTLPPTRERVAALGEIRRTLVMMRDRLNSEHRYFADLDRNRIKGSEREIADESRDTFAASRNQAVRSLRRIDAYLGKHAS